MGALANVKGRNDRADVFGANSFSMATTIGPRGEREDFAAGV